MYSVFVVEDEIVTREGIRNSIPWDNTRFSLVGEAPDGEMALHAIREMKPDILITDIRMPFMDGLTLARIVKEDMPWVKIIILSGHDEFQYARQAITIGVERVSAQAHLFRGYAVHSGKDRSPARRGEETPFRPGNP